MRLRVVKTADLIGDYVKSWFTNTKKSRLRLFWLVAVFGTIGPWACAKKQNIVQWYDVAFEQSQQGQVASAPVVARNLVPCNVESVYDGDTAWLVCAGQREKIRLYCIDAPEMQQAPWGKLSRDHLRSIIGTLVRLERVDTDRYGRTVGRLISEGGRDLNLAMVETGNAVVYPKYCPRSEGDYYSAESRAKAAQVVVWSVSGDQSAPWHWRKQ